MNARTNCKIPWVRDEVILALAFYVSSRNKSFNPSSEEVQQFSKLLRELPLYFSQTKPDDFRNCNGMHYQLSKLHMVMNGSKDFSFVAKLWADVVGYYRNQQKLLITTASAISKASKLLSQHSILAFPQECLFIEGCILEKFHSIMERSVSSHFSEKRCMICGMYPSSVYVENDSSFLETHLLIEPWKMSSDMHISEKDTVFLCPNCHKILHSTRPWVSNLHNAKILAWENK